MTVFPTRPPADPDNLSSIRAHDWEAFLSLDQMEDHWARPDWKPDTRAYYWMVPCNTRDLIRLAEQCQTRVASPAFDPVPLDALHITVGRIGLADQVTPEVVRRVAGAAQRRCADLDPFRLEIGPLAGSRGALRFSVSPWSSLLAMHHELAEATAQALGSQPVMDTSRFRPHLSIAYANTRVPLAFLRTSVQELRELAPITVSVSDVSLVELWRDGRTYRFSEVARVGFAGPSTAAVR